MYAIKIFLLEIWQTVLLPKNNLRREILIFYQVFQIITSLHKIL